MSTAGWQTALLGDVAVLIAGATPKGVTDHLITGSGQPGTVPFFKVGDMNLNPAYLRDARVSLPLEAVKKLNMRLAPVGAVVFPKAGGAIATNKKRVVAVEGALDLNCMAAVAGPAIDVRYLRLWFESLDLNTLSDGSILPQLSKKTMAQVPVPLPPLDEQRRIVALLEDHLSRLDAADVCLTQAVRRGIAARASVLDAFATLSLTESGAAGLRQLSEVIRPERKISYGVLVPGPDLGKGTRLVRIGDLQRGRVLEQQLKRIAPEIAGKFPRSFLQGGEVLLSVVGTIGRTAVVPNSLAGANVARAVAVLPVDDSLSPDYLSLFLQSPRAQRALDKSAHEVARKTLNLEDVKRFEVPVVPLDLQRQQVVEAEASLDALERLEVLVEGQRARGAALRRALLRSAFSGELAQAAPTPEGLHV